MESNGVPGIVCEIEMNNKFWRVMLREDSLDPRGLEQRPCER